MKKYLVALFFIILITFGGCSDTDNQDLLVTQEGGDTGEAAIADGDENAAASVDQENSDTAKYTEGEYAGQIDSNSIEVIVDGGAAAFRLTDAISELAGSFQTGDAIVFEYQQNEQGQNIIVSFGEQTTVVTFEGQMDPHSIEVIKGDGSYDWFQLTGDALEQVSGLDTGDIIKIQYTFNESGQKVANQLIKVEK
ncbi:MAG: hypothetical protein PHO15_01645 [Eubacteriales bacterium]|nr:hypothetical protein [Eubacteriales bacterium]